MLKQIDLLYLLLFSFLISCSSSKEIISTPNEFPVAQTKAIIQLPDEKVITSYEGENIQLDILHCFGNPDTREITLLYKMKNWGPSKSYSTNGKGNSLTIKGQTFTENCVSINGEADQCGVHFKAKVLAKTNAVWKGKYIFKHIKHDSAQLIDKLTLLYSIGGEEKFAELTNIPIKWNSTYLADLAKSMPQRHSDDNNGLILDIETANLNKQTRELAIHFTAKNLSGKRHSIHINARENEAIIGNQIYNQSCASFNEELKCDIHWTSNMKLDPGESTEGKFVFRNVKSSDEMIIQKLQLRYNLSVLHQKAHHAIFGKIPIDLTE